MSIVTISRGSYSRGKEVAERLAEALGYECLSREIVIEASEQFNIPEVKLIRAIHDAPSILDRFSFGKERFIAFFRAALLKHLEQDNVVFHGLAGHFFLQQIPHILKVRIIADLDARIREEMKREDITAEQARQILLKDDAERRKWGLSLYGLDTWDYSLYDMTVHIKTLNVDDAVSIIRSALRLSCFKTTPHSKRLLKDLSLSAQVEAALVKDFPKVTAHAAKGEVFVNVRGSLVDEKTISGKVRSIAEAVDGVNTVHVNVVPFVIEG